MDRGNGGQEPGGAWLQAILHGVAAGACRVAARETGDITWAEEAGLQSMKATRSLHHAAHSDGAWAAAKTSSVTPRPRSLE